VLQVAGAVYACILANVQGWLSEEARMAHSVDFTVPERPLGNADVTFWVKRDGGLLGRLEISKGKIVWYRGTQEAVTNSVGKSSTG
jgi:hypothetical protein